MRWSKLVLLVTLVAGCGASPLQLLHEGRGAQALDATYDSDTGTRQSILRAVIEEEAPTLTIEAVEGEELARLAGEHTARRLAAGWMLLRATLATRGRLLPQVGFGLEIGREGLAVPSFAVLPIKWLDEDDASRPKTMLREKAPRTAYLAKLLPNRCDAPGACARYFLLRRPRREDQPLSVRAHVTLTRKMANPLLAGEDTIHAVVTAPLPSGPRLRARLPSALALARLPGSKLSRNDEVQYPPIRFCAAWSGADLEKGHGGCLADLAPLQGDEAESRGLTPPPPPASLGTPTESLAKRPWWAADATYAPPGAPPEVASQDASTSTELAVCSIYVVGHDSGWLRLGAAEAGAWTRIEKGTAVLPLAHIDPGGALRVEVWEEWIEKRELAGSTTLERSGAALVATKPQAPSPSPYPIKSVTCTPYDRVAVETAASARWPAAVDAVDLAAEETQIFVVDLAKRGFQNPSKHVDAARAAITALAALLGWSDPRVIALVTRLDAVDAQGMSRIKAAITAALGDKRDVNLNAKEALPIDAALALRIVGARCSDQPPCGVDVEILDDDYFARIKAEGNFEIVMDDGHSVDASLIRGKETLTCTVTPYPRNARVRRGAKPWVLMQRNTYTHKLYLVP